MVSDRKISYVAFWFEGLRDELTIAKAVTTLAKLGYTGVDWKSTCFDKDQDLAKMLKLAKRIGDDNGITTCNAVILGNMIDDSREKYIADTCAYVRACAEAGIPSVNCVPGGGADTPENWGKLVDALDRITRVCDETNIDLALESVFCCLVHDFPTTQKMFSMFDNKHLKLTMDPSHYYMHKSDIPAAIRTLGKDKIAHVHVKDCIGVVDANGKIPPEWIFPILGEGNIDWNGFFGALDDIGYDKHMSIEFEAWNYMDKVLGNDITEAARLSIRSMQALISNYVAAKSKK